GWPENFCAETCDVEARRAHGHHLDSTASQAEGQGPDGILAHPVDRRIERGEYNTFRRVIPEGEIFYYLLAIFAGDVTAEAVLGGHDFIHCKSDSAARKFPISNFQIFRGSARFCQTSGYSPCIRARRGYLSREKYDRRLV